MKIEAGKYYKTRDGRKVGPMEKYGYQGFDWAVDGGALMYDSDGRRITKSPHDDLIAEWTDGPTITVGAKVRVTSADYGKEQLGKTGRVVEVGRAGSLDVEIEYDEPLIHANGLKRNQYRSEHLELITEGPVRTVTRREVVSGQYGRVSVTKSPIEGEVGVRIKPTVKGDVTPSLTASELKAAAAVLLELAGALDD